MGDIYQITSSVGAIHPRWLHQYMLPTMTISGYFSCNNYFISGCNQPKMSTVDATTCTYNDFISGCYQPMMTTVDAIYLRWPQWMLLPAIFSYVDANSSDNDLISGSYLPKITTVDATSYNYFHQWMLLPTITSSVCYLPKMTTVDASSYNYFIHGYFFLQWLHRWMLST